MTLREGGCGGSPGIDEVLGQADVGRCPCDGDLALRRSLHGVGDLDLRARHLTNLVYFGSLAADDATNELQHKTGVKSEAWVWT